MKQKSSVSLYWRRSSNKNFLSLLIFTVSALLCKSKNGLRTMFALKQFNQPMSFQNSEHSTSTSSDDVVRATESLLSCHLLLSTGSPLNAPYSFCDKDLPADRGLLTAFTWKAGFPPLSRFSPVEKAGGVSGVSFCL